MEKETKQLFWQINPETNEIEIYHKIVMADETKEKEINKENYIAQIKLSTFLQKNVGFKVIDKGELNEK